jgi:hypothetical protein
LRKVGAEFAWSVVSAQLAGDAAPAPNLHLLVVVISRNLAS